MACNKLQVGKLKVLGEGYGLVESNQAEIRIPIPSGKFVKPGQLIGFTGRDVWLPVDKGVLSPHLQDHEDLRAPAFPSFRGTVVRCDNSDGATSSSSSSSSSDPKLCVLVAENKASSSTLSFSGPASDTDEQMLPHQLKLAVGSSADMDMEVEAEEEKEQDVASTSRSRQSTTSTTAHRKGSGSSISIGGVGAGGSSATSSGVLSLSACSPGPPEQKAGEILREKISGVDAEKGTTMKAELPSEIVAAASRNLRDSLTEGDKIACGIDVESGRVCAPVWKLLGVLEESQAVKAGAASAEDSTRTRERGEPNDVNMTCAGRGGAGTGDASSANNERGRPPVISIPCTIQEAGEPDAGTGDVDMADAPGTAVEAVAKPDRSSEDSGKGTRAAQATATSTSQQAGQKLYSLLNKNGAQQQVSQTIQPPLDANNPLSNQSFRNRRGALPGDEDMVGPAAGPVIEDIDTNLENIRMGTVTSTITPDGDHTVILTQNREMLFAQTDMLANFLIPPGTDIACSVFTNEDGHPVVDPAKPIWELSTPFKEEQTPFFGQYYGRVINLSSHGNGFVDCECLKQEYGHDPFIHAKIMRLCQIRLGDLINFTVHINSSGTPQVSAPVWRKCVPPGQEISFAALEAAAAEAAAREANGGGMGSCNGSGNGGKGGKRGGGCNAGDGGGPLSLPLPGLAANSTVNRTNSGRSSSPDGLGALAAALGMGPTANDSNDLQTKSHNSMPSSSSGSFHAAHTGSGAGGGGGAASSSSGSSAANFNNTAALISSSSSLMITETGELQQTNSNHAAPNLPSHSQLSAPAEPFGAGAGGPAQVQPPSIPSPQMSASIPPYGPAAAVGAPRPPHLVHGPYTGAAFTASPPGPHHASLHPPPPPLQPGGHVGQHAPVHHAVNPHHPPPMNHAQHSHSSPLLNPNMMVPTGAPHPQQQQPSPPPLPHQPQPPPPLAQLHPGLHPHWATNVTSHLVSSHGGMQQFQVQLPPNPRQLERERAMYDKAVGVLNSLGNNQGPAQQGGETSWEFVGALANSEEARNPEKVGRYEGYIKNVNHHGHGFVSSPSFPDNDVFVHKKVMERCKLFAEDRLRFNVHVNGSGTAQCSAPVWVLRCSRPHTHPGTRAPQVQPPPPTGHHVPYY